MIPHKLKHFDTGHVTDAQARLQDVEETLLQLSTTFRAFRIRLENQLTELKTEVAEEMAEKSDALVANENIQREIEALLRQMKTNGEQYQKKIDQLGEENEELLEDVKGVERANKLLRGKTEGLEEQIKQLKDKFDIHTEMEKSLYAENEKSSAELLYLRGVERKFILELQKNAAQDEAIQELKCEIEGHKAERTRLSGLQNVLATKTQESDELIKDIEELRAQKSQLDIKMSSLEDDSKTTIAKVEDFDGVKNDNFVLDQRVKELLDLSEVMEARYKVATDHVEELTIETDNFKQQIQAVGTAAEASKIDNKIMFEMKSKIRELQGAQAINQHFTYIGALVRKNFVLVGGGALDHTDASLEGQLYRLTKEPSVVADAALFKMGILSKETDGAEFKKRYGSPYLPVLDYAAHPRFCEIMDLEARVNAWLAPESPARRGEKWAQREMMISQLQKIWGADKARGTREFETSGVVASKIVELKELSDELIELAGGIVYE